MIPRKGIEELTDADIDNMLSAFPAAYGKDAFTQARSGTFSLTYYEECPYEIGDSVYSPVKDAEKECIFFGPGFVESISKRRGIGSLVRYEVVVRHSWLDVKSKISGDIVGRMSA